MAWNWIEAVAIPCKHKLKAVAIPCKHRLEAVAIPCKHRLEAVATPCKHKLKAVAIPCKHKVSAVEGPSSLMTERIVPAMTAVYTCTLLCGRVNFRKDRLEITCLKHTVCIWMLFRHVCGASSSQIGRLLLKIRRLPLRIGRFLPKMKKALYVP